MSRSIPTLPRVYLAGKIAKNDWRHTVVPGLRGAIDQADFAAVPYPPNIYVENRRAHYEGPFFAADDHGCAHGKSSHGNGIDGCFAGDVHDPVKHRVLLAKRCETGIRKSDHVFVWLDSKSAYGTLVEIGLASALGKQVWIYSPRDLDHDDLWFASHLATNGVVIPAIGPVEAVRDFLEKVSMNARAL